MPGALTHAAPVPSVFPVVVVKALIVVETPARHDDHPGKRLHDDPGRRGLNDRGTYHDLCRERLDVTDS